MVRISWFGSVSELAAKWSCLKINRSPRNTKKLNRQSSPHLFSEMARLRPDVNHHITSNVIRGFHHPQHGGCCSISTPHFNHKPTPNFGNNLAFSRKAEPNYIGYETKNNKFFTPLLIAIGLIMAFVQFTEIANWGLADRFWPLFIILPGGLIMLYANSVA